MQKKEEKKAIHVTNDPRMECKLWQKNLTLLQIYGIATMEEGEN